MVGRPALAGIALVLVGIALVLPGSAGAAPAPAASGFNHAGDVLITDQYNNRVIEVNPATDAIVWSFGSGNGSLCNPGPHSVIGPNYAVRLGSGDTLIAGTGIGPGVPGTTPCVDNRVLVVNPTGQIVWQYGRAGVTGAGYDELNTPVFAVQLQNHNILITDQGNNRIIQVNLQHRIVWSYGPTSGPGALNSPNSAERLPNGNTLITDENGNRVLEVNHAGAIVWQYARGLSAPAFASRLPNGDTLIADSGNNRVLEVSQAKGIVWQFVTNATPGSNATPNPTGAVRTANGWTYIADQFNDRVIAVAPNGTIVWQYGTTNVIGNGPDQLYAPYSVDVIGDYTGQTVPPTSFR